ncbi:HepT-like ribonuclease domain-containing protein [Metabacillus crassostreae]|uniref:HepT-like ribonuclease domain-containing protein n=1 Tax=Metabacillus crassostreae TaxID=929098 RepID=UPI001958E619
MYFVDREDIEAKLIYLEDQIKLFRSQPSWESSIEKAALERICHMTIETIIDVGNSMIDGFIMRDPGSYEDIIDILLDEKVVNDSESKGLKKLIALRKILVQEYLQINYDDLLKVYSEQGNHLTEFPKKVRTYIENELGPVSAFKPVN